MEKIKKALERARVEREPLSIPTKKRSLEAYKKLKIEPKSELRLDRVALRLHRVIDVTNPEDPIMDYYRLMRSQVLQELGNGEAKILCITGPTPNEGKTLTAINLAISLSAQPEFEVVLIDADLRNPSIDKYLGKQANVGLVDVLNATITLDQASLDLCYNSSVFLPAGTPTSRSSELINSIEMKAFMDFLRKNPQRVVIIDLPPVLSTEYAASLAAQADGVLLVVSENDCKLKSMKKALAMLNTSKANTIGLVLNKSLRDPEIRYYRTER